MWLFFLFFLGAYPQINGEKSVLFKKKEKMHHSDRLEEAESRSCVCASLSRWKFRLTSCADKPALKQAQGNHLYSYQL